MFCFNSIKEILKDVYSVLREGSIIKNFGYKIERILDYYYMKIYTSKNLKQSRSGWSNAAFAFPDKTSSSIVALVWRYIRSREEFGYFPRETIMKCGLTKEKKRNHCKHCFLPKIAEFNSVATASICLVSNNGATFGSVKSV